MKRRESANPFGLSFLDVAFCALGGILLLMMAHQSEARSQLARASTDLARLRDRSSALAAQVAGLNDERVRLITANARLTADRDRLTRQTDDLRSSLAGEAEKTRSARIAAESAEERARVADDEATSLRRRVRGLVALRGTLQNVVIVFDRSGSLKEGAAQAHFDEVKRLAGKWLEALPVKKLNVVAFDDQIELPAGWEDRLVEATDENRRTAGDFIAGLEPRGSTETERALRHAAERLGDVDTVLLFTDGDPNGKAEEMGRVLEWLRDEQSGGRRFVVNTVGMGNYVLEDYGLFLQRVAKETGGVFIGL